MPFPLTFPFPLPSDDGPAPAYARQLKHLLPPGPAFSLELDGVVDKTLQTIASELGQVDTRGLQLIEETDPRTAYETISDWEEMVSLPDEQVPVLPATIAARRLAVTQKLVGRGGQNEDFFSALAAACGYVLRDEPLGVPVVTAQRFGAGGTLADGIDYGYRVTAFNATGETEPSELVVQSTGTSGDLNRIELSWDEVPDAGGYRIYGRQQDELFFLAEVGNTTFAYVDDGSDSPAIPTTSPGDPAPTVYLAIERYAGRMLRAGFRAGDRVYGVRWAYAMVLNVQPPVGAALSHAELEAVIRHATHAHIKVGFIYR